MDGRDEAGTGEGGRGRAVDVGVAVVGAGLAGLAAAVSAGRRGVSVAILDVRSPGGRARSETREGFVLNQGPHAIYRKGAGAAVLERLGVRWTGTPPSPHPCGYREATGELAILPTSAGSLLRTRLVGPGDKLRLGRLLPGLARVDTAALASESAASWIASLGLRGGGAELLSTLVRVATYAPDLGRISADAAVGQLQLVAAGNVAYLDGGWQTLVDQLVGAAGGAGVALLPGRRVTRLVEDAGGWRLDTPEGPVRADTVVVAPGGPDAARSLLPGAPSWDLGDPATAACLELGLRRPPTTRAAFGLDEPLYLSTHAPAAKLAPEEGALVHVARYGARSSDRDREQLRALARRCGVLDGDVVVERFLHAMTVCPALPRPGAGLPGRPAVDASGADGVLVAGDWVGAEGLLADAALASGEAAGHAAAGLALTAAGSRRGSRWSVRGPTGGMVHR
jgi:phytoene dehydrogenase-like protein